MEININLYVENVVQIVVAEVAFGLFVEFINQILNVEIVS